MINLTIFFVSLWVLSFLVMCYTGATWAAIISGALLMPIWGLGHNFLHQRDTILRFLFNLTLCSSHEWRVSHAISHHQYTNTLFDLEIISLNPLFIFFFSSSKRHPLYCALILFYVQLLAGFIFLIFFIKNILFIFLGLQEFRKEYFIPFIQLLFIYLFSQSYYTSIWLFTVMHFVLSFLLVLSSWAVHHHDGIWHDGDPYDNNENDFGRHILLTTRAHSINNLYIHFLLFAGLNDHIIHHLFPVLDHSRFNEIREILDQTKKEFGITDTPLSFIQYWRGVFRRLVLGGKVISNK